jgi:hypothetical protein
MTSMLKALLCSILLFAVLATAGLWLRHHRQR